ncbi:MAG: penicillin acylase family protein [Anaerolineae bacterium]
MITAILITLILLIIAGLLALGLVIVYAWVVLRPLAQHQGSLRLPGLQATVEVLRDRWGIPHVYAGSEADLWFAQGVIHAQDRLWQMELSRRVAQGRLAELFGSQGLEADRLSRTVGLQRSAARELAALPPRPLAALQRYADGVNAIIARLGPRPPAEFTLLRFSPEPWTPLDCLACARVFAWSLSGNWESELLRTTLLARLGPERTADLEPEHAPGVPLTVPGVEGLQQVAGLLLGQYDQMRAWFGAGGQPGAGSNAWAVDGRRAASGKPLLASDPHLAVQMPCPLYENHLEVTAADGLRVTGASLPGLPGILHGHNAALAWGLTNAPVDTQDLFVEQRHPTDPRLFRFQEGWEEAQVLIETIRVRGQAQPERLEIISTRHGPLLNGLLPGAEGDYPPLALRWSGHEAGGFVHALLGMNRAQTRADFQAAAQQWATPVQNVVYADREGAIASLLVGLVPARSQGLGLAPAPGWTGTHEWSGWVAADALPQALNPASGYVVSANQKLVGDDYPFFLTLEWADGFRARRIADVLRSKPRHTRRDFEVLQNDVLSLPAQQMVSYFSVLNPDDPWERTALRLLVEWNYRADRDSAGAAIFALCHVYLLQKVFGDKLGPAFAAYLGQAHSALFPLTPFLGRASHRLLQLLEQPDAYWFANGAHPRTRDELLQETLTQAVKTLLETVGDNPRRWQWGRLHQAVFRHPLGETRLGWLFSRGPVAVDGDGATVAQSAFPLKMPLGFVTVASAYRQIIDLDNFDQSLSVLNVGQSGQPGNRHYSDQIEPWREGEYHPLSWSRAQVEEVLERKLILEP